MALISAPYMFCKDNLSAQRHCRHTRLLGAAPIIDAKCWNTMAWPNLADEELEISGSYAIGRKVAVML